MIMTGDLFQKEIVIDICFCQSQFDIVMACQSLIGFG